MEWRDQVAVVTGGARGLGRATAWLLAQRGAAVCVNYVAHADAAETLIAEIAAAGGRAIAVATDVADAAPVEAMIARTEAELGPVTILVNNAGLAWQAPPDPAKLIAPMIEKFMATDRAFAKSRRSLNIRKPD